MKLLIFSDSHLSERTITEAWAANRDAEIVIHAGDGVRDIVLPSLDHPGTQVVSVRGNCDWLANDIPLFTQLTVEAVSIMIVHGHMFDVKSTFTRLIDEAHRKQADICIFGHTHERLEEYIPAEDGFKPLYLFNPGAAAKGSFGLINIVGGQILLSHGSI